MNDGLRPDLVMRDFRYECPILTEAADQKHPIV
jgi:hypothetical protein